MAAPPSLPPGNPLVDIHNTFGAVYIGNLFSIGLLGVTIVQAWLYYNHFPKDPIWIKMVVLAVCVVEFLRSTLTSYALYYYLVLNWGNIAGLTTLVWSLKSILVTTMVSKLLGHFFFSWRIYILSPPGRMRYFLTALVIVSTLFDLGTGTATFVNLLQSESFSEYTQGSQRILAPLALATSITTDAIISCCMVFVLSRSKTGFSRTNRLLNTFILYAIEAGLITVVSGTVILTLNQFVDNSVIRLDYVGVYAVAGNLYANSLLATLNARRPLRIDADDAIQTTSNFSIPESSANNHSAFFRRGKTRSALQARGAGDRRAVHLQTFVTTSVEVMEDKNPVGGGVLSISPRIAVPETSYEP